MTDFLRIALPLYFVVYFSVAIFAKSFVVAKHIGKNPLVFPSDDTAYGLIGIYFKITLAIAFVYVLVYAFLPSIYIYFLPMAYLNKELVSYVGLVFMLLSFIWTVLAQSHMKNSWRIGIDSDTKTELITIGLFSISRNPIFLGMIVTLAGLFLTTPNALTLLIFILGTILIQVQVRLEEEYLTKQHGQEYLTYKHNVRRFL
ncbi:MAG: isoprenylcysteine carboxylmethyltransferase family protein [Paludibacteraceae bacterium]